MLKTKSMIRKICTLPHAIVLNAANRSRTTFDLSETYLRDKNRNENTQTCPPVHTPKENKDFEIITIK